MTWLNELPVAYPIVLWHPKYPQDYGRLAALAQSPLRAFMLYFNRYQAINTKKLETALRPFYANPDYDWLIIDGADALQTHTLRHLLQRFSSTSTKLQRLLLLCRSFPYEILDSSLRQNILLYSGTPSMTPLAVQKPKLEIYTLGTARFLINGKVLGTQNPNQTYAILLYLVEHGATRRDAIMQRFWKDTPPHLALQNLHAHFNLINSSSVDGQGSVRNFLGFDLVATSNSTGRYQLAPQIDLYYDVQHYEELERQVSSQPQALHTMQTLYRGHFLPNYSLEWVKERRHTLQAKHSGYLQLLADEALRVGQTEKAFSLLLRACYLDSQNRALIWHTIRFLSVHQCYCELRNLYLMWQELQTQPIELTAEEEALVETAFEHCSE